MNLEIGQPVTLSKAKELFKAKDYLRAQEQLSSIISANPNSSEAYFYLANIFHIRGELGKAIKAFQKVLDLDPANTDAAVSLSVLFNDIGRYEEAKTVFDTARERVRPPTLDQGLEDQHVKRKFAAKHHELGDLYASYNQFEDALTEYNKATTLHPENLEVRIKTGKLYAKRGFHAKAQEELRRLKNEYPDYVDARIALGLIHFGTGNVLEAQAEWQMALSLNPSHDEAKLYLQMISSATETTLSFH